MSLNWQELGISSTELEELLNFDLLTTWAINLSRVCCLRLTKYRSSLIYIEACIFFLSVLLLLPVNLIIFRNFGWLNNNSEGLILMIFATILVSFLLILVVNYYLWNKAKRLKIFAILLEKVKQYNNLIDHLNLAEKLNSIAINKFSDRTNYIPSSKIQVEQELKAALSLTKNSLIKSLELEKIIAQEHHLTSDRYQLLTNLESGLVNLLSLTSSEPNDYQQLLSEAIELGLSVHQEIRKNPTLTRGKSR